MKKSLSILLALASAGLAATAVYLMASAPAEPPRDWPAHMTVQQHALMVVPIDHSYRVAAYFITWAIQLGYLGWLAMKWHSVKRAQ
jgi:hypothetical protein